MPAPPPRLRLAGLAAWTGAVLFAAALAVYLHFFFVHLGQPVPPAQGDDLPGALVVNAALFGAFALHHSVMARQRAKAWLARYVAPSLERTLYVCVSSALLVVVCVLWRRVPGVVYVLDGPAWLLGALAQTAGVALTAAGAARVDPLELAGVRQARGDHTAPILTAAGPFRIVRHPIYLGWILIVFGAPVMTVDRLAWASISSAYLVAAIPWEERSLRAAFGEAYQAYCAQVRWRLIPGVW